MHKLKAVIVGGGTSGWMTAAALSKLAQPHLDSITLIESEQIGTVGVGEATIPHIRYFNSKLNINEHDFVKATNATYKLGINFENWGKIGDSYLHPFGEFGNALNNIPFHHYWLKAREFGDESSIFDYSIAVQSALEGRFAYPQKSSANQMLSSYSYAFHIDANKYASFLREHCEKMGVTRVEGKVSRIIQDETTDDISKVCLEDSTEIEGDLFIDCSGFRSLLLGDTLNSSFDDWSEWLSCDTAVAVPSRRDEQPLPYTRAIAHKAGWRWEIPLQNRTGNGIVFNSNLMSEDEASNILLSNISNPLAEPRTLKFKAGCRTTSWKNNCIGIGLSSGFLEPLESTSIYLIQQAITHLLELFPSSDDISPLRDEYNRRMKNEYDRIRDFLILHYHATERDDSEFWKHCKHMSVPNSLQERINTFKDCGYIDHYEHGLFLIPSWLAVYIGQGIVPERYHPKTDQYPTIELLKSLASLREGTFKTALSLPSHQDSLSQHLSDSPEWPPAAANLYGVFS